MAVLVVGCGSSHPPLECPSDHPTKSSFEEVKTYDPYEVAGDHPNTFLANARGARPFSVADGSADAFGLTESKLCLEWQLQYDATSCRIAAVRLVHRVRITLPKWKRPKDARPAFVEWDEKMSATLASHEEGHYQIAASAAHALYERALTITTAPTCDELDRQFAMFLKEADTDLQRKNREYDTVTKHGTVSGASPTTP